MKHYKTYIKGSLFCPFLVLILFASCSKPSWEKMQGEALGTSYSIQYLNEGNVFTEVEMDSIMLWINHALSTYQKKSLITAFNTNDNSMWGEGDHLKYWEADIRHFLTMVQLSEMVYNASNGAFDPTAARLFELYDEAKRDGKSINTDSIAEALTHQGLDKIALDPNGFPFKKDKKLKMNFNAVAKGYAVDEVADFIESKGIVNYMVEIGGEVRVAGHNPTDQAWTLGVNTPDTSSAINDVFEAVSLDNNSMATSGNYRNFYALNDSIIGHTIDPRTGIPVINKLKSATVFHKYCAIADAFATACMVLGPDSAKLLIEGDTTLSAYFIVEQDSGLMGYYINR